MTGHYAKDHESQQKYNSFEYLCTKFHRISLYKAETTRDAKRNNQNYTIIHNFNILLSVQDRSSVQKIKIERP